MADEKVRLYVEMHVLVHTAIQQIYKQAIVVHDTMYQKMSTTTTRTIKKNRIGLISVKY